MPLEQVLQVIEMSFCWFGKSESHLAHAELENIRNIQFMRQLSISVYA